jgi:hypothetical protein
MKLLIAFVVGYAAGTGNMWPLAVAVLWYVVIGQRVRKDG